MNLTRPPQPCVLVIDDDPHFVRLTRVALESSGYRAIAALDIASAFSLMEVEEPHLVLLDFTLPSSDRYDALRRIRQSTSVPLILLGSTETEGEKVNGLNLGADDFICKPFSMIELLARINALLRRVGFPREPQPGRFSCGEIEIDFVKRQVTFCGQDVDLSRTEYKLLCELVNNVGKVMLHEDLLSRVWGSDYKEELDYLRVYIRHLRRKLEADPSNPRYILSKPGIGYVLVRPAAE